MIVIGEKRPDHNSDGVEMQDVQPLGGEFVHSIHRVTDVSGMFIAGCGDKVVPLTAINVMGTVKWTMDLLTPLQNSASFLIC